MALNFVSDHRTKIKYLPVTYFSATVICCYAGYNAFCKPAAEAPELEDSEQAKIPIGDENIYSIFHENV